MYIPLIIILSIFARQFRNTLINQALTGFKPTSQSVIKAVYACMLPGKK